MSFLTTFLAQLTGRREKPCVVEIHGSEKRIFTGGDLLERVALVRAFLRTAGVGKGDRVSLVAANSACWVAVDIAIIAEGAISVPLYPRQDPRELCGMLGDCTPKLLIAGDGELLAAIVAAANGAEWIAGCVTTELTPLFAGAGSDDRPAFDLVLDDPVTIIYTSGTSGEPKGVVYNRQNIDYMLPVTAGALHGLLGDRPGGDEVFHYLPLCFAGSRIALWTQLFRGNAIMLSTDLNNLQEEIATADPHYFLNVPALLERVRAGVIEKVRAGGGIGAHLLARGTAAHDHIARGEGTFGDRAWSAVARAVIFSRIKRKIGRRLEFLICGSAPLGSETQSWFQMIGIPVYQIYGLTETTGIVTIDELEHVRTGWVGIAIDGCEIELAHDGELICRGANIFPGYWNRPEATAATVRDGWLHTGDQAEIDDDGNCRIVGRLKDVLIPASGHNVAPEPIEERLRAACGGIDQAVVVGHGRAFLSVIVTGDVPCAAIEEAVARCNADLPHYERLRRIIHADVPFSPENGLLTANQKLRRGAIESHFGPAIDELYR